MSKAKARISVVFLKDYADKKKGETLEASRSLANSLISLKVAELSVKKPVKKMSNKEVNE